MNIGTNLPWKYLYVLGCAQNCQKYLPKVIGNIQDLCSLFDNYSKYLVKSKRLAIKNQTKFSLDAMTKKFEEILDKHLPKFDEPPKPVELNLPKLKKIGSISEAPKIQLPKLKKAK